MRIRLSEKQSLAWALLQPSREEERILYGGCFRAGTLVRTIRGLVPIQLVERNDMVLSLNVKGQFLEWKPVINTFAHKPTANPKKMITFISDRYSITSTSNHEFYLEGRWLSANNIAGRIMEVCTPYGQPLHGVEHGEVNDFHMEGREVTCDNETGIGHKGVLSDNDLFQCQKENCNGQNSQSCCNYVDSKPKQLPTSQSHKFQQERQQSGKLGVGISSSKHDAQLQCGEDKETDIQRWVERGAQWNVEVNGGASQSYQGGIYTKDCDEGNVSGEIRRTGSDHKGHCFAEILEAHCIDPGSINDIIVDYTLEVVYDLEVKDNHNYLITNENIIVHNSAGGGKTHLGCTWQLERRINNPGTNSIIARKVRSDLYQTTYLKFMDLYRGYFDSTRKSDRVHIKLNSQTGQMDWSNGSITFWKELKEMPGDPDFERLGSYELCDAFVDEAGQIKKKAADMLFTRIRHRLVGGKKKLLFASNPSRNFLKSEFVSDSQGKPVRLQPTDAYVRARVYDNPDKEWAENYAAGLARLPLYDRMRLLEGDWEVQENDYPFYSEYHTDQHTGTTQIDPWEPLWLSFDFNLRPTTCIVGQKLETGCFVYEVIQVDGGTEYLCQAIKERGIMDHQGGIFVTGDSSGTHGNSAAGMEPDGRHKSDFGIIQDKLVISERFFREAYEANRRHVYSGKLCNYLFKNAPVKIDQGCYQLLVDLGTGMTNDRGGLVKDREQHKQDAGDAFRYLVNAWFPGGIKEVETYIESLPYI